MLPEGFRHALKQIHSRLKGTGIDWAVIGSTNLAIHGMDVEPNDLDIVTSIKGIEKVEERFSEHVSKGVTKGTPTGDVSLEFYEMELDMKGVEVHFLGGYDKDVYFGKVIEGRTEMMEVGGLEVPCLTLRAEAEAYRETGREEVAEKVEEYLDKL